MPEPVRQKRCLSRASSSRGMERRQAEVVEQVVAELEVGQLHSGHEQEHGLERDVPPAQGAAQRERAVGVGVGHHDGAGPAVGRLDGGGGLDRGRALPRIARRGRGPGPAPAAPDPGRGGAAPSTTSGGSGRARTGETWVLYASHSSRLLRMNHSKTCSPRASAISSEPSMRSTASARLPGSGLDAAGPPVLDRELVEVVLAPRAGARSPPRSLAGRRRAPRRRPGRGCTTGRAPGTRCGSPRPRPFFGWGTFTMAERLLRAQPTWTGAS